jgi:hypothetical protein
MITFLAPPLRWRAASSRLVKWPVARVPLRAGQDPLAADGDRLVVVGHVAV